MFSLADAPCASGQASSQVLGASFCGRGQDKHLNYSGQASRLPLVLPFRGMAWVPGFLCPCHWLRVPSTSTLGADPAVLHFIFLFTAIISISHSNVLVSSVMVNPVNLTELTDA